MQIDLNCDLGEGCRLRRRADAADHDGQRRLRLPRRRPGDRVRHGHGRRQARRPRRRTPGLPRPRGLRPARDGPQRAAGVRGLRLPDRGARRRREARVGAALRHVKPHGALYNMACRDDHYARPVVAAAALFGLPVMGLPGSRLEAALPATAARSSPRASPTAATGPTASLVPRTAAGRVRRRPGGGGAPGAMARPRARRPDAVRPRRQPAGAGVRPALRDGADARPASPIAALRMSLRVLEPGLQTLVVDCGRPASRSLGVPARRGGGSAVAGARQRARRQPAGRGRAGSLPGRARRLRADVRCRLRRVRGAVRGAPRRRTAPIRLDAFTLRPARCCASAARRRGTGLSVRPRRLPSAGRARQPVGVRAGATRAGVAV